VGHGFIEGEDTTLQSGVAAALGRFVQQNKGTAEFGVAGAPGRVGSQRLGREVDRSRRAKFMLKIVSFVGWRAIR
jgi:hypothetical protein